MDCLATSVTAVRKVGWMVTKSKCDRVVDDIVSKIVNRIYVVGDRLPTEAELCRAYDVSRVTVRESLKKLQMMGMISIEQGRGTFVKKTSLGSFMQPMFNLIDFGEFDIMTIYTARQYVETGTSRLAALNRTDEDLRVLDDLMAQMRFLRRAVDAPSMNTLQDVDTQFHIRVAAASRNEILRAAVVNLEMISAACAERIHKSHAVMDEVIADHGRILEAIRNRDPDAAEAAMTAHTQRSGQFLLRQD